MPESSDPLDLDSAMAEGIAHFSIRRDLAFEVLVQLEEAPLGKLRSTVLRIAKQHPGPVTTALLKLARRSGDENPLRETQLARLALKVVRETDLPADVKRALLAEAETLVGDGWRRRGDLREAERAFVRAAHHLEEVGDPHENALYLSLLAHLREDQHRPEEALALRERAASLFEAIGQIDDQAETLLAKAALEIGLVDIESALADLRTILALTDKELRPDLAAIAVLGYGTLLGQMRRTAEALAVIGAFRKQYPDFRDQPALAEIDLLEGALLIFSDRREVAEAKLEAARRELLRNGNFEASAEACLNLALLFLLDGRREPELRNLADLKIEPLARSRELPEELRAALNAFCVAVKSGKATAGLAGALRETLRGSRDAEDAKPGAAGRTRRERRRHGY